VVFVKYRKVSTRTILPNFIDLSAETALYSRFRGVGKNWKKEEATKTVLATGVRYGWWQLGEIIRE